MRKINKIILHCSDTISGDVNSIRKYHIEKNKWSDIGYHFIILNGQINSLYLTSMDGSIEIGRPITKIGAHCKGENTGSIGICVIGKNKFTEEQCNSLYRLLRDLCSIFNIPFENIHAHNEFNSNKTCPNFDVSKIVFNLKNFITPVILKT